jgi:hypothetical protein
MKGRPFQPGNKFGRGRPRGSRNQASLAAQALMDSHSEPLIRKCLVMALQGDAAAMRLCMERVLSPRREQPVRMKTPRIKTAAELSQALEEVLKSVACGRLTPGEAQVIASILESRRQVIATEEFEQRLRLLELQK